MKVTITSAHLQKAIDSRPHHKNPYGKYCLIGQVAQEVYGSRFKICHEDSLGFGPLVRKTGFRRDRLPLSKTIQKIIGLFDGKKYDDIERRLPLTVKFPDFPACKKLACLVVCAMALSTCASAVEPVTKPTTPVPYRPDSYAYHRGEDYAFGLLISAPVGMASRPWIGLVAGEAAGVANEARYGRNFNMVHLAVISVGALTGYGLAKWAKHEQRKADKKYGR